MNKAALIDLMDRMDDKIKANIMQDPVKFFKDQFIMNNILLRYMEYFIRVLKKEISVDDITKMFTKNNPVWIPPKRITYDFDIGRHESNYYTYLHSHAFIELDYVYKGGCKYYINNTEFFFTLKENEMCIVNQHIVHGIEATGNDSIIIKCMIPFGYIELELLKAIDANTPFKQFLLHALSEDTVKAGYIVVKLKDGNNAEAIFYRLFEESVAKDIGWRHVVKNYLSVLFIELMRTEDSDIILINELEEEKFNIAKAFECIQKNYPYITLKDMAKDMHYHKNYLSRLLQQNFKQSFRELLSQVRLKEAETLLLKTDMSVCEIALKIGYQKPNYFYKTFKENYGLTPIEYRKKYTTLNHDI